MTRLWNMRSMSAEYGECNGKVSCRAFDEL